MGSQLGRGVRLIWSDTVIRRGMVAFLIAALPVAAVEATAAAYARLVLHAGAAVTGELAAAVPVGIMLAVPLLPKSGSARHLLRAAAAVAMLGSLVAGLAFGLGGVAGAVVGYLAAGVLSGSVTPAQIAYQPRIAGRDRPAVFSLAQMVIMGGQAVGAAVGGLAAAAVGPRHAALGWMGLVLVLSVAAFLVPVAEPATVTAEVEAPTVGPVADPRPWRSAVSPWPAQAAQAAPAAPCDGDSHEPLRRPARRGHPAAGVQSNGHAVPEESDGLVVVGSNGRAVPDGHGA